MIDLTDRLLEVLRIAMVYRGRIAQWGDGATEQEIQDLVALGLLAPVKGNPENPRYEVTSMGVQAHRRGHA